jgi:translation initiation factor 6
MKAAQADFSGDRNLGMYAKSSDEFCISGRNLLEKDAKTLKDVLKVDVIEATIFNTDLIGIFAAFNSNGIVLPKLIFESELKHIRSVASKHGMNVSVLDTKYTAVGNMILCNDRGCAVSESVEDRELEKIESCLGVKTEKLSLAGLDNIGSCGVATNRGCIVHRDASEEEIKKLERTLKVDADIGTANFGSPFIGGCIVANSNGVVMGNHTTGPEIARIMETLDLL